MNLRLFKNHRDPDSSTLKHNKLQNMGTVTLTNVDLF